LWNVPRIVRKGSPFDVDIRPLHFSSQELESKFRDLVVALYGAEAYTRRRRRFVKVYRPSFRHPVAETCQA
jgi:hypothetical protein